MDAQKTINSLMMWLRDNKPDQNNILVPVSGGSDSAFCFWLCSQVFPAETKGLFIGTALRQYDWFAAQGKVQLDDVVVGRRNPEVQRWAHFLEVSLQEDRVLTGSRNLTESSFGTFSNASRVAALLPLVGLWKHQVMELCDYIGMPKEITDSSRRADPECGRPQKLADIPFEAVDMFLMEKQCLTTEQLTATIASEQREYLEQLYARSSYKARLPLVGPSLVETVL